MSAAASRAFEADLTAVLGGERVLAGARIERWTRDTSGASRNIRCVLKPSTSDDIPAILSAARRHRVAIYPISTGRNWGYGTALPTTDGCALLDLSDLNRVLDLDQELGLVTVEPGVTQHQLHEVLRSRGLPFMVPVTGAGPDCSLLGNALERGYGITPHADHFGAVRSLEVVLADGSRYRSALGALGAHAIDRAFKWGTGPFLDGIFTQSNLGVVTSMTIALARRPEVVEGFLIRVEHDDRLEPTIDAVRETLRSVGGVTGAINVLNDRRVLSMFTRYPTKSWQGPDVMPKELVRSIVRQEKLGVWNVVGMMHGDAAIVAAAKARIRREFTPVAAQMVFFTRARIRRAQSLLDRLPSRWLVGLRNRLGNLSESFKVAEGEPMRVALKLAYWRQDLPFDPARAPDPASDGCGLIWYSPLVPMKKATVRDYVTLVERICLEHEIEPLITLTSLNEQCFDSTVPLLFDRSDSEATERARRCYLALFREGAAQGLLPYRVGVDHMHLITEGGDAFWDVVSRVKQALDPDGIIAPGRYCRTASTLDRG